MGQALADYLPCMMVKGKGVTMAGEQVYELADEAYPLVVHAGVTMLEEIRCLLDAGWTWDGNKLVHPTDKGIWRIYTTVDSSKIGRSERLDAEILQAVQEARRNEQRMHGGQ
jgi:hypothetical protein